MRRASLNQNYLVLTKQMGVQGAECVADISVGRHPLNPESAAWKEGP